MKSIFKPGFMFKLSCRPSVVIYVAENKTLAGKEDRTYEGEATGRKLAFVFFEPSEGDLVRRVDRSTSGMQQQLLSLAELLQTIGGVAVPADPDRSSADTELLLESLYQTLDLERFTIVLETGAPEVHVYSLDIGGPAEAAMCMEVGAEHRTKMMLARALERSGGFTPDENLQGAWSKTLAELRARTAHLFPVPATLPAPHAPPPPPAPRGRGRGRGRAGPPAPAGPAAPAAHPPPPAPRGRGRARGRGR